MMKNHLLSKLTIRRYFLPEDGDNEEHPNVFLAPKSSNGYPPRLGQIKDSFPLPGSYHFRFKTALVPGTDRDKHAVAVWMDCVDDSKSVPVWHNSIVAKGTRLGCDEEVFAESAPSMARTDSNVSAASVHSSSQPVAADINTQSTHDSLLGSFDDPSPAPAATSSAPSSSGNLLDVDNHLPSAPASGNSLLDMDVSGYGKSGAAAAPAATAHDELLNMSVPAPSSQPVPQQQQPMQQQAPMQNQYGMQYPAPGQQQQQQRMRPAANGSNTSFNNSLNPLDNLKW